MKQMQDAWLLDVLRRLARGIVAVVGPNCEVAVHDFSDFEHSTVVVAGNVTGRKPGAPIPDLSFLSEEITAQTPDQLNYRTKINNRNLQSSTIWIRDDRGKSIGAVCINVDYSEAVHAREIIDKLLAPTLESGGLEVSDTFARDMDELIEQSVAGFLRQEEVASLDSMNQAEKLRLIQILEERGLFKIRGAVPRVAQLLNVSRASIYNYRSNVTSNSTVDG